jgi:Heterokaryon incompatibility protein (HET)
LSTPFTLGVSPFDPFGRDHIAYHEQTGDCGKGVWEPPLIGTIGGGQTAYIDANPSSDRVLSRIRSWLSDCVTNHDSCRRKTEWTMPSRVLDVETEGSTHCHLKIDLKERENFATLSYRWGLSLALTTTEATLAERVAGIAVDSLPRTLRDAVIVTRKLGLRYIWIDALCIIQDSAEDWEKESSKMGHIYANAYVNISAGCAPDTQAGFLNVRDLLKLRSCKCPDLVVGENGSKYICPAIPRPDRLLNSDILNSRGWILQERALSRRTIHFGPYEVYWECLVRSASEREPEDFRKSIASELNQDSQTRRESWLAIRSGLHYVQDPSQSVLLNVLGENWIEESRSVEAEAKWVLRNLGGQPKICGRLTRSVSGSAGHRLITIPRVCSADESRLLAIHHLWYMLAEDFSLRSLTKVTDTLPALSGIAQIFAGPLAGKGRYLAGMWESDLMNGLCWSRDGEADSYEACPSSSSAPRSYIAPSFCWTSLKAPISIHRERGEEQPVGMTVPSQFEAAIEEAEVTLAGADPFGKVVRGYLRLKTYTIPYENLKQLHPNERVVFDSPQEAGQLDQDGSLLCMSLRSQVLKSNNPSHFNGEQKECLALVPHHSQEPLKEGDGQEAAGLPRFKRVGYLKTFLPLKKEGPSSCPDCDFCRSGEFERLERELAKLFGPKTDEEKAAQREKEEREKLALGYGEWAETELVIV